MKIVAVIMLLLTCSVSRCLSEEPETVEIAEPEPVLSENWDNQSYQYWNVQPMSVGNVSEISFNNTGDVNITMNLTAYFHEPLLWEQGYMEYMLEYNNETVFNVTLNLSNNEMFWVNLTNVSGNITVRIQSNGSDDPASQEPGDFFIARNYAVMTSYP